MDDKINPEGVNANYFVVLIASGVLAEAIYFNVQSIIPHLQDLVKARRRKENGFTRADITRALIKCPTSSSLRAQGLDLSGLDLRYSRCSADFLMVSQSRLDLSNINFKMTSLEGANLEKCNLDNTLLQEANLARANLQQARYGEDAEIAGLTISQACEELIWAEQIWRKQI